MRKRSIAMVAGCFIAGGIGGAVGVTYTFREVIAKDVAERLVLTVMKGLEKGEDWIMGEPSPTTRRERASRHEHLRDASRKLKSDNYNYRRFTKDEQ